MADEKDDEAGASGRREVRPFWSGTVTFGLVSIPVELYTAHRPSRASMRIVGPEGRPLRRVYVCPEDGRRVSADEIVRGYEVAPDSFVLVTDEELEGLQPDKTREIDLRRFVDRADVDAFVCDRGYFLLPQGEVTKPYRLLAQTMEKTGRAGIATFVMRGKQYLIAIFADRGVLRAETLRLADELRSAEDVGLPEPVDPPKGRVKAWREAIRDRAADGLDEDELTDERAEALRKLAKDKAASGEDVVEVPEAARGGGEDEDEGGDVIDIMDLLQERMGVSGGGKKKGGGRKKAGGGKKRSSEEKGAGDLRRLTKDELYERAQEAHVRGRSKMSKEELIRAL